MSDDVKVTFSADTSSVENAISTINNAGGGGGRRPPGGGLPTLPAPGGPLGPRRGGKRAGDWRDGAIDVDTVTPRPPPPVPPITPPKQTKDDFLPTFGQAVASLKVVSSFFEDAIDYAAKVKLASIRSGESVQSIQRLTNAAMMQGISFDEVTGALTEGSKKLGQGLVHGGAVQLGLSRLGVSMEQIRNKSVSTTEVLMKMADLYKQTGDNVQMANLGVSIFGSNFNSLIPMLKEGRTAIQSLGNEAGIMSKEEIEAAALAKAQIERGKKTVQNAGVETAGFFAKGLESLQTQLAFNPVFGTYTGMTKDTSSAMARSYYGRFAGAGEGITDFAKSKQAQMLRTIESFRKSNPSDKPFEEILKEANLEDQLNMVNALIDLANRDNEITKKMPGFQNQQLAAASSLQSMGGGDVLSAMTQNPQQQIADNTSKTVEVLERIDSKTGNLSPAHPRTTLRPPL